jgi:hypothetical protein
MIINYISKKTSIPTLTVLIILILNSCIDPYNFDSSRQNKVLVIEGILSDDLDNPDTIKIQYSYDVGGVVKKQPAKSSKATVFLGSTKQEVPLIEKKDGCFLPPANFKINTNEKYTLRFTLADNTQYESTPQQVIATPSITNIYESFNPKSRLSEDGKRFLSANEVFIDVQDEPAQKNFYLWQYTHYERLSHCVTCDNQLYDFDLQSCVDKSRFPALNRPEPYYDYVCLEECYAIFRGKNINVFSDVASNGRLIEGRLVAKIPFYSFSGCVIEVKQMCVSAETYNFYKVLESQTQTTGGLTDSPPSAIVGNIRNVNNPLEKIVGFFFVAEIKKKRLWIDRANASGPTDLVLGHTIVLEPQAGPPFRPPPAPCKPSATRTRFKPDGWR